MYDPRHSPEDVQAAHLDALMDAMLYIQRTLKDRTSRSRDRAAALKALAQVTLALQRQRPPEQSAQLAGYSPHEIHSAVADLVREHDGPELRSLLGRGAEVITGEED
jgi:hypothetical protein